MTSDHIRRGAFTGVTEPEKAMHDHLDCHTAEPKPFAWSRRAEAIPK